MITKTYHISTSQLQAPAPQTTAYLAQNDKLSRGIFFDIETTGFQAQKNALYLMGCCRLIGQELHLIQWLAENKSNEEQTAVISAFLEYISDAPLLISYNGAGFDLPFIEKKCQALNIFADFSCREHLDLYKILRPYKTLLGLENLKLKTIERFLGIFREDMYSGGALIPIYDQFVKSGNENLKELLLLHNYEDIKDMLFILPVLAYDDFFNGQFQVTEITKKASAADSTYTDDEIKNAAPAKVIVTLTPNQMLPAIPLNARAALPVPTANSTITLSLAADCVTLEIPLYSGELKFYYPDHKNYFYLPEEDYAIHKTVAEFVDKAHKKKATPATCYIKKAGDYLPQGISEFSPAFKFNNKDVLTWFEYKPDLSKDPALIPWIQSFLRFVTFGSF